MFSVPLMYCEYRDVSLLTSVHPSQHDTALCDSAFTGSNYALCIQKNALELSVNTKMCDPCPICSMVMYMVTADARNYRRFNMSLPCHAEGIFHPHDRPLFLYPLMPHSQASDHIVNDGLKILCCWLGTPWWWNVGGVSSIVGYLLDYIVGAVAVPISLLSSVSGVSVLRSIVLEVWHVLRDWDTQSTIPA